MIDAGKKTGRDGVQTPPPTVHLASATALLLEGVGGLHSAQSARSSPSAGATSKRWRSTSAMGRVLVGT
jgi:hypothetical protein